jgi:aminoglycoside 6'-N-acetyltransferase
VRAPAPEHRQLAGVQCTTSEVDESVGTALRRAAGVVGGRGHERQQCSEQRLGRFHVDDAVEVGTVAHHRERDAPLRVHPVERRLRTLGVEHGMQVRGGPAHDRRLRSAGELQQHRLRLHGVLDTHRSHHVHDRRHVLARDRCLGERVAGARQVVAHGTRGRRDGARLRCRHARAVLQPPRRRAMTRRREIERVEGGYRVELGGVDALPSGDEPLDQVRQIALRQVIPLRQQVVESRVQPRERVARRASVSRTHVRIVAQGSDTAQPSSTPSYRAVMTRFTWRRLAPDDFPLLSRWLAHPHVARWWNHDPSPDAVARDFGPATRGEDPSQDLLVLTGSRPVGLVQRCRLHDFPEYVAELSPVVEVPPGAATLDYLVGDASDTGHGLGPAMIAAVAADTWREYPDSPCIIVAVAAGNRASWRALEKAGFRRVAQGDMPPDNPIDPPLHYVYRLDRPPGRTSPSAGRDS